MRVKKQWKKNIDQGIPVICFFCGKPITRYRSGLNPEQHPMDLTMEYNQNGLTFAQCFRKNLVERKVPANRAHCFPAHCICNLQANRTKQTKAK